MTTRFELTGCPVCESSGAEEIASAEAMRHETEWLWEFRMRRLVPGVPVRNLVDRLVFSHDPPLRLARCLECGTIYRNPREAARAVVELYEDEEPDAEAFSALFELQRDAYAAQMTRLVSIAGQSGVGLEVGSYVGAFLAAARERGWSFEGLDVNHAATRFARERGLSASTGTIEERSGDGRFDAVAIWNCFDQLPDPRAAARAAHRLLGPGGILAVRVPNGAFYTRWRRRIASPLAPVARALLAQNNLLGFPYLYGFTPGSLRRLLRGAGFETVQVVGDTLVPTADRWTRRWASVEEAALRAAIRMYRSVPDRMPWFEVYARAE